MTAGLAGQRRAGPAWVRGAHGPHGRLRQHDYCTSEWKGLRARAWDGSHGAAAWGLPGGGERGRLQATAQGAPARA